MRGKRPFGVMCAAVMVLAWSAPGPAAAALSGTPPPASYGADELSAKSGGTIVGRISSIDYRSGMMVVDVGHGRSKTQYSVLVVPGTNITGQRDFGTIADLKRGAHVEVFMSRRGAANTAQIIRLL